MTDLEECAKRVGTIVNGKWTLEKLIGVGGMAAVYVAVHKIGRKDAIKILHAEIASSPEVRARFEQEAHAVNRFKHPGVVEIRDIDITEKGEPFLVMELLEGVTLSRLARETGVVDEDVLRFTDELLDVLAAAHAQGIVHRDIKPDNLFVLKNGRLKVLDFGIARVRSGAAMQMKTRTGTTLGTVSYMSPEQARGGDIDGRADLFSVGAMMFRLIAKRKVHEAENDLELLKKMATEPAPPLASAAKNAPPALCAIVDRALRFSREQRYPDAAAMQADVRALLRGASPPSAASRAVSPEATSVRMEAVISAVATSPSGPIEVAPISSVPGAEPTRLERAARNEQEPAPPSAPAPTPPSTAGQLRTAKMDPIARPMPPPPPSPPFPARSAARTSSTTILVLAVGALVGLGLIAVVLALTLSRVQRQGADADASADVGSLPDEPFLSPTESPSASSTAVGSAHKPSSPPHAAPKKSK